MAFAAALITLPLAGFSALFYGVALDLGLIATILLYSALGQLIMLTVTTAGSLGQGGRRS